MLKTIFFIVVSIFIFSQCTERNPSTANFNVYFWYPNNSNELYLGTAKGLDQCGTIASNHAISKNLTRSDGWSYVCCLKTSSSECAEKHR